MSAALSSLLRQPTTYRGPLDALTMNRSSSSCFSTSPIICPTLCYGKGPHQVVVGRRFSNKPTGGRHAKVSDNWRAACGIHILQGTGGVCRMTNVWGRAKHSQSTGRCLFSYDLSYPRGDDKKESDWASGGMNQVLYPSNPHCQRPRGSHHLTPFNGVPYRLTPRPVVERGERTQQYSICCPHGRKRPKMPTTHPHTAATKHF